MQLLAQAERGCVHPHQACDQHHEEDLPHERLEDCIAARKPGGRREVAVPDGGHGDVAEVREVGWAVLAGLREERMPRHQLQSVVGIGEDEADEDVDAERSENGLRGDAVWCRRRQPMATGLASTRIEPRITIVP